jgi:hypothetical protein
VIHDRSRLLHAHICRNVSPTTTSAIAAVIAAAAAAAHGPGSDGSSAGNCRSLLLASDRPTGTGSKRGLRLEARACNVRCNSSCQLNV